MTPPSVPRNAYTDAPEQHPNWILGSLQLLFWLFFRPSAWRNNIAYIECILCSDSEQESFFRWSNTALWRLRLQVYFILPVLATLPFNFVRWRFDGLDKNIFYGMAWGIALIIVLGFVRYLMWGLVLGVAWGLTLGVAWGWVLGGIWGLILGIVSEITANVVWGIKLSVLWGLVWGLILGGISGLVSGAVWGVTSGLVWGLASGLGFTMHLWRPVILYPFLTIWNTLLYQFDKRGINNETHLLRYHSAFWDEFQFLPLLGLDKHVVLVSKLNPAEGQAAIKYLSTSKQQWAAWVAQVELYIPGLANCTDIEAIRDAHISMTFGEIDSPVSLQLRTFTKVSEDVSVALNQESAYNQRLTLKDVADRLNGLLRKLISSNQKYASGLYPIAKSWHKILTDYVNKLAEAVELRKEIDSPYIVGLPLTKEQEIFIGRTDLSFRLEKLILDRRRPPILLYGQRRMGKTSLLNNLGRLLPNSIIPMFVDLQGPASSASDNAGFLYNLARGMRDSAQRQASLTLPPLSREDLTTDPFTNFDEWLDKVEQTLQNNTALLALDEFEKLDEAITKGRFDEQDVLGMLRHLIQHRRRFKVLLAGSHTIEEFQRWASYLINVQVLHISYLQEPEARQLIERPVKDFTLRYEPDAVERVLALTRCHPCLVQLLCSEIVALKNEQEVSVRRLARLEDIEEAVPEALSSGSFFFADIELNQIDKASLAVLRFLAAQGEGAIVKKETLFRQFRGNLDSCLSLLLRRELIEPVGDGYGFQVELIRRWFARS
ncbi:MAG: AAA family ATPase [Coleofasciculaceae cyanobacterium]